MSVQNRRTRWAAPLMAVALLFGFAFGCTVEQTEEGELPEYDVDVEQTEEGNLPEYDVDAAEIEIGTEEKTITVPDVDVNPPDDEDDEPEV